MKRPTARGLVTAAVAAPTFLGLAVLGYGGLDFFQNAARRGICFAILLLAVSTLFAGTSGFTSHCREDASNRWVFLPFAMLGMFLAVVPSWTDRAEFWSLDGDMTRYAGLLLFAVGGVFRVWPMYQLGHRFSPLVAVQRDHTLMTAGPYRVIRHPSYLGLALLAVGWTLVFRSAIGLLAAACMVPVLLARIRSEEAFLAGVFGAEFEAYRSRTWKLLPYVL